MLKKIAFQYVLIGLLVLAQAGMLTHEISHYAKQRSSSLNITSPLSLGDAISQSRVASIEAPLIAPEAAASMPSVVSYTTDEAPVNPSDPRHLAEICLQCLSFAQIGLGLLACICIVLCVRPPAIPHFRDCATWFADIIAAAYRARAPPLFISTRP